MSNPIPRGVGPVSLGKVAAEAGVSIATVSRIVNGEQKRASVETIARVQAAIKAVGYHPNQLGRALRRRESKLVAMLISNLDNPVMAAIAASTEYALRQAGYVMILCDTHDRADLQDEYLNAMRSQVVHGYVMVACQPSEGLRDFVERGAPMVFSNRRSPFGECAFVGIDNAMAGADVADHLLDAGISDLAVAFPTSGSSASRERVRGFCDRAIARGVEADRIRKVNGPGLSHLEVGYAAARQFQGAAAWPRGMLCVSDQLAYGAYRAAGESGVRVPEDCRIIGIDGNPINRWIATWLSSVEVSYQDVGPKLVELLLELWGGSPPREILLPYRLPGA